MCHRPINLPSLIANHIHSVTTHSSSSLPYGRLLTFLFTNLNIDLSSELFEPLTRFMIINEATVKRMGYRLQNKVWVYQVKAQPLAPTPVPSPSDSKEDSTRTPVHQSDESSAPPSSHISSRSLFKVLDSIWSLLSPI